MYFVFGRLWSCFSVDFDVVCILLWCYKCDGGNCRVSFEMYWSRGSFKYWNKFVVCRFYEVFFVVVIFEVDNRKLWWEMFVE